VRRATASASPEAARRHRAREASANTERLRIGFFRYFCHHPPMMNYNRHEYRSSSRDSRRRRSARVYPAPRPAEAACRMPRAKPLARSRRVQASATRDSAPARQPTRLRPRDSRDTTRPARLVPPRSSRRGGTRKPPRRRRAGRGSRTPRRATTEAGGGSPPRPSHWLAETHRQRRKARVCKL
jgi:hypothetical protein